MTGLVCLTLLPFLQFIWIIHGENARSLCTLATPDIVYTENSTQLNVSTDKILPADGKKFWVGYVKVFESFQYRGCSLSTNITFTHHRRIEASPGYCYSFCGTTHIGLSGTTCYCIPELDTAQTRLTQVECDSPCSHQPQALCGSEKNNLTSIYTKVAYYRNNNNRLDDEGYFCLSLQAKEKHIEWSSCESDHGQYRLACQNALTNSTMLKRMYNKWSTIMRTCMENDRVPAFRTTVFYDIRHDIEDTRNLESFINAYFWLGEIRSLVIKRHSVAVRSNDEVRSRGYIELINNTFYLNFEGEIENQYPALCHMNEKKDTPGRTAEISIVIETTEYTSSISNTDSTTDSTLRGRSQNQDDSLPLTVSLAVAVPVFIVTLVVIIVCCIWKRRREKSPGAPIKPEDTDQPNTDPAIQGSYFKLEPVTPNENTCLQPNQNDGEYELADEYAAAIHTIPTADDTYDHTTDIVNQAGKSDNIYNKSEQCNKYDTDDTYDHTHDKVGYKNKTENVYNKTESEETYDCTGGKKVLNAGTDNIYNMTQSDDIYNTSGVATDTHLLTDNVYDTTDTDTYSHTQK